MVAGSFPLVKLGYLALKQVSKPIANQIKRNAKSSPFFRNYICMPPAQCARSFVAKVASQAGADFMVKDDFMIVNFRLRLMGLGQAKHVEKLKDEIAIELGAEMLGEFIIFAFAAATVTVEYQRSAAKEAIKEEREKHTVLRLQQKLQDLDLLTEVQATQIRELQHKLYALESQNDSLLTTLFGGKKPEN